MVGNVICVSLILSKFPVRGWSFLGLLGVFICGNMGGGEVYLCGFLCAAGVVVVVEGFEGRFWKEKVIRSGRWDISHVEDVRDKF